MRIGTITITSGIVCLAFILSTGMAVGALTHQYEFEGNAADGIGFINGIMYGDARTTIDPTMGSVLSLDGRADYVSLSSPVINTRYFTLTAWANQYGQGGGNSNSNPIFVQRGASGSASVADAVVAMFTEISGGNAKAGVILRCYNGTTQELNYVNIPDYQWHHYALVVGPSRIIFYVDGNEVDSISNNQSSHYHSAIDFTDIGRNRYYKPNTGLIDSGFFNGLIDDMRIYNEALNPAGIVDIYHGMAPRYLSLQTPKGGEQLIGGIPYDITWNTTGEIESVKLEYKVLDWPESDWMTIDIVNNAGSYQWTVPPVSAENCLVRVSALDDPSINSVSSNTFLIIPGMVTITCLAEGEKILGGAPYNITWDTAGQVEWVQLQYKIMNWPDPDWINIGIMENTGSFEWAVPPLQFRDCYLRVVDAENPTMLSRSGRFTVVPAFLDLTAPTGGEKIMSGTTQNITWDTRGNVFFIRLEFRAPDANYPNWTTIEIMENSGFYEWSVPGMDTSQCQIRVSDIDNPQINSVSEDFKVYTGEIYLQRPNGGEELVAEHYYDILWDSVGDVSRVKVEYMSASGPGSGNWNLIDIVPNTGFLQWLVPNINSTRCLVRVTNVDNPRVQATSEDYFTILGYDCGRVSPADMNGDCRVNLADLSILAQEWLSCDRIPIEACDR